MWSQSLRIGKLWYAVKWSSGIWEKTIEKNKYCSLIYDNPRALGQPLQGFSCRVSRLDVAQRRHCFRDNVPLTCCCHLKGVTWWTIKHARPFYHAPESLPHLVHIETTIWNYYCLNRFYNASNFRPNLLFNLHVDHSTSGIMFCVIWDTISSPVTHGFCVCNMSVITWRRIHSASN